MEEEKITLDRKAFKSLASDTRIGILKSLDRRRKTLSELSKEFGMSVSTISEHLSNLAGAELVAQRDEGRKWKYYELTRKGKGVLYPETRKIWVVLAISVMGIFLLGLDALRGGAVAEYRALTSVGEEAMKAPAAGAPAMALPWIHIIGIAVFAALLGAGIFLLYRNRVSVLP